MASAPSPKLEVLGSPKESLGQRLRTRFANCCCVPIGEITRRSGGGRPGSSSEQQVGSPKPSTRSTDSLPPADLGFAKVSVVEVDGFPRHEVRIEANEVSPTEDGISAMLKYLDTVLRSPKVQSGFVLCYVLGTGAWHEMDPVSDIMSWSSEPQRQEKWTRRCVRWKFVCSSVTGYQATRMTLGLLFYATPPSCEVWLVRDLKAPLGDDAIRWGPNTTALAARLIEQRNRSQQHSEGAARARDASKPLPPSLNVGFCFVEQGYDDKTRLGFLKITGSEGEQTEEGLQQMMDFMDAFTFSKAADKGFCIIYDLRALRLPSMTMVTRIAEWGSEPERQARWEKLNRACKVIVSSGLRFSMCKGVLTTFFYVCPPVCKTYLLSDPDEPEDCATIFMPTTQSALSACSSPRSTEIATPTASASPQGSHPGAAPESEETILGTIVGTALYPFHTLGSILGLQGTPARSGVPARREAKKNMTSRPNVQHIHGAAAYFRHRIGLQPRFPHIVDA